MSGPPIFDYPATFRAADNEGCRTCGIVLEADAIGAFCSPECCEWPDRCAICQRGPTWCVCEPTHCCDCGEPLSARDQEARHRTCKVCAEVRAEARRTLANHRDTAPKEKT